MKRETRSFFYVSIIVLFFWLDGFSHASAETQKPVDDVFELSLEELMETEVISASRKGEKAFVTPDAIYVISNEDIRRSGHTSIADLLRMVPGVHVAQIDANKFAVTIRGFNNRYANKLLVQIDGRTVYSPLHSGVYWEIQDLVFEDIDRIEVIRGPGATLWGANAVNGIVNIITKSSKDTQGLLADGAYGGKFEKGALRWGGQATEAFSYRVYGKGVYKDAHLDEEKNDAYDEMKLQRGGFRCDWEAKRDHLLTFQGEYYSGEVGQYSSTGMDHFDRDVQGFHALMRYSHTFSTTSNLSLQIYYDRDEREDIKLEDSTDTFDADLQHHFGAVPWNDIVWGVGFRQVREQTEKRSLTTFIPNDPEIVNYSAFLQDRITVLPEKLFIIAGTKIEDNYYTGVEMQPSGKILITPNDQHTIWLSVSRAVRTPSIFERSVDISVSMGPSTFTILKGNPNQDAEVLYAYEMGYRIWPVRSFSISVAGFYNDYDELLETTTVGGTATFENKGDAHTYGGELSLNWNIRENVRLVAWYAYLDGKTTDSTTGEKADIPDPRHVAHARCYFDLPYQISFSPSFYYVDDYRVRAAVPEYYRLDARLAWSPTKNLELSLVGQSLLVFQNGEFVDEHIENQSLDPDNGLIERSIYGQVAFTWK